MICYDSHSNRVELVSELGRGGEAAIYKVKHQENLVAKIYHSPPGDEYVQKLFWMKSHPPDDPGRIKGHASIAWPQELLFNRNKQLLGYLMPFLVGTVKLINVINPALRRKTLPGYNWKYLHRTAYNLAVATKALHDRDYVIGDLNESNVMVSPSAMVTLIDTDSFQVISLDGKKMFYCPVGKPEYTPAELQGVDFKTQRRDPESDYFALGVLIFQLLFEGSHPFRGKWVGEGDPPHVSEKIRQGWFPYAKGRGKNHPPPNIPAMDILHPGVRNLVMRCFVDGHKNPKYRPSPEKWMAVLETAEASLKTCSKKHYYSTHLRSCPWCARRASLVAAKRKSKKAATVNVLPVGKPVLSVRKTPLKFGLISHGERVEHKLTVKNSGGGSLRGTLRASYSWLVVNPSRFELGPGGSVDISLIADTKKVKAESFGDSYSSLLTIHTNGGMQQLEAQMRVGVPVLELDKKEIDLGEVARGDTEKATLVISNAGGGVLSGKFVARVNWLTVSPANFTCAPGAKIKVTLRVKTRHLADFPQDGMYTTSLFVHSNGGYQSTRIKLNLQSSKMAVDSEKIDLGMVPQGELKYYRLEVRNNGSGTLKGDVRKKARWIKAQPNSFRVAPGETTRILVMARTGVLTGSLKGKKYQALLSLVSNSGELKIPISVQVCSPRLRIEQNVLDFGSIGKGSEATLPLAVQNVGKGNLFGRIRNDVDWLSFEDTSVRCEPEGESILPVTLKADIPGLPIGKVISTRFYVKTNGGSKWVNVRCRLEAPLLKMVFHDDRLRFTETPELLSGRFTVENPGQVTLHAEVASNVDWLQTDRVISVEPHRAASGWITVDRSKMMGLDNLTAELTVKADSGEQRVGLEVYLYSNRLRVTHHEYSLCLTDVHGIPFVFVAAGDFKMGGAQKEVAVPKDERIHTRHYLDNYWISKFPVTNEQYKLFVDATGATVPSHWLSGAIPAGKAAHPVVNVSFGDSLKYCEWVNQMTGLPVRLPSEAEWEKAARGEDGRAYPWGDEPLAKSRCNYEGQGTSRVGRYGAAGESCYGCADMCGNVWEWTNSLAKPYPYLPGDGREELENTGSRVLRGGSWFSAADQIRVTHRLRGAVEQKTDYFGFRLAMSI